MVSIASADLALIIMAYVVAINCVNFIAFAWDKYCARQGNWRVKEQTLLFLSAIGGSAGAIAGQRILRHKTRKEPFKTCLLWIIVLQVVFLIALSFPAGRELFWSLLVDLLGAIKTL